MVTDCYIAGAGEFADTRLPMENEYVIAADGGYKELMARGIMPDLVVGDFDSLGKAPEHPNVVASPVEKDDTDVMLAVRQGLERGCRTFVINGGTGGRLDHTLSNIQVLIYIASKGCCGVLLGQEVCLAAVRNGSISFGEYARGTISIFSAGDKAIGVTLQGLKYPLHDATLTFECPIGVSNEFTGRKATVAVRDGTLVISWAGGSEYLESLPGQHLKSLPGHPITRKVEHDQQHD